MQTRTAFAVLLGLALLATGAASAAERYVIDTRGQHAFIQFRIPHLGFSWLYGRFNDFEGEFTFDTENPENSRVNVTVQTPSIDTNHERRDEHLRGEDFLTVADHPVAEFESTAFTPLGDESYRLTGNLHFMGETREVSIDVTQIGAGKDPWGGYRRGFEGTTSLTLADWGIAYDLGESAREVELTLSIEGVRQAEAG
ncbi:MAG: YceI family protein [Wenzhouxiangellaceae bacterium]